MTSRPDRRSEAESTALASAMTARLPFVLNLLGKLRTSYPLVLLGAIETGLPFFRMLALTHILSLTEVGFVSVLTAFYSFLELSTDIAIHRFVYAAPKHQLQEALASAHALSLVRGVFVCFIGLCAAPFVASLVSLGQYWLSFALVVPPILIRSFENLSPKIAERDFNYWPQLKVLSATSSISFIALIIVGVITKSHDAIIVSLYAQCIVTFFASRLFSDNPYRLDFRSPLFKAAYKFAYPLMINGLGLSIALQGDRFVVAAFFDLQTLAIYSVVMLAAVVPMSLLIRVLQTTIMARLYHASSFPRRLSQEVKMASSLVAVVGVFYAAAVVLLLNPVVTLVFGQKFKVDHMVTILLGAVALVRLVRLEPFTSVMLNASRTKRLAASNILTSSSLVYMAAVSFFARSVSALLAARLGGELTSLVVTVFMARKAPEVGRFSFTLSTIVAGALFGVVSLEAVALERFGDSLLLTLLAFAGFAMAALAWGALDVRHRTRRLRVAVMEDSAVPEGADRSRVD